jgi:hypothetical protein
MLRAPQGPHAFLRADSHPPEGSYRRGDGANSDLLRDGKGPGHGGDRGPFHSVPELHRELQMAEGS